MNNTPLENICAMPMSNVRPVVRGKFIYCEHKKFYIKGVTYGTFKPAVDGHQFPDKDLIERDFKMMSDNGINCVRTYTIPPISLMHTAHKYGLKVMVGLPWEQHITFLDSATRRRGIIQSIKEGVLSCLQHPAILCFTIGNEIPAPIVRWYGATKIESFLKKLYNTVKDADQYALVTYVNYPTTEYLDLTFLDFFCFNVYLETPEKLSNYISRLHNLSKDRPLVLAEIGLDSLRNGDERQARTLTWQIHTIFRQGCAGMFVFAWTDEWWRGGFEIKDWNFGIVDRDRHHKKALFAVTEALREVPYTSNAANLPFISVVICSYNGSATIRDTLEGLQKLEYNNFEVIVVNDGSIDNLVNIVEEYPVKLITTKNCGLSSARNTGLHNAKGEIIAYIDDDAYPDPQWLTYLAFAYAGSDHVGIGGPNIIPDNDGPVAQCVANAPGGPVHVLLTDEIAEHIPGCNMSFKKSVLLEIGGFDPIYRSAGDDVDVCWRIQELGNTIGYHASALVWHHRRNSLKAYWKQQVGYGKAEALLETKWPNKYNAFGHITWGGRIYGNGITLPINLKKRKIFHGIWGSALFQSIYQPANGFIHYIPLMPEWYLISGVFAALALLGFLWSPLHIMWPIFISSIMVILIQAIITASKNTLFRCNKEKYSKYFCLIVLLHIMQPIARLRGRIIYGLTPWRKRGTNRGIGYLTLIKPKTLSHWSESNWKSNEQWLEQIEKNILILKGRVKRGGNFDRWDIKTKDGLFSNAKGILTVEEHGANKQYVKLRYRVNYSLSGLLLIASFSLLLTLSIFDHKYIVSVILSFFMLLIILKFIIDSASAVNCMLTAFRNLMDLAEKKPDLNVNIFNKEDSPIEGDALWEIKSEELVLD